MPGTICKVSVEARVLFPKQLIVSIREIRVLAPGWEMRLVIYTRLTRMQG